MTGHPDRSPFVQGRFSFRGVRGNLVAIATLIMHALPPRHFHRTDKRTWSLLDEHGHMLGSLVRPSWFSRRVELTVASGIYEVKALKPLSSAVALFAGDLPVMIARYKWRDTVVSDTDGRSLFKILRKGWLGSNYRILDAQDIERFEIRTRMSWKRFDRDHEIKIVARPLPDPIEMLFILQVIITQEDRVAAAG